MTLVADHEVGTGFHARVAVRHPEQRRNALRAALTATAKDPQFLSDAANANSWIDPRIGEETMISRACASSPAVVERAKAALRPD